MRRNLLSLLVIGVVASTAIGLTSSFFSDTETSTGNVLQAGTLDLLVDDENDPFALVDVGDLKPGDEIYEDKKLTVQNSAWVWMHLIEFVSDDGQENTEPEDLFQSQYGVKFNIEDYLRYDLSVAGEDLIASASAVPFPNIFSCWIPLGVIEPGNTTVTQSFHFDSGVDNWAQTDMLSFSEEFYAVQARNNPSPTPPISDSGRVWDPETKTCLGCEGSNASYVESFSQGLRKNGTPVLAERSDPNDALGAPQSTGTPYDNPVPNGEFVSLGFGGTIVLHFDKPIFNETGDDFAVYEVTGGSSYPEEKVKVEASQDGVSWTLISSSVVRDANFDLGVLPWARYLKFTDVSTAFQFEETADGYDLDAVVTFCDEN